MPLRFRLDSGNVEVFHNYINIMAKLLLDLANELQTDADLGEI
jgi:hypothetical protein